MLAQGDDGGGEVALLRGGAERAGVVADDRARGIRGPELLERRVDLDGLEVEQFDAGHLDDVGCHVARQAEVDDELAHAARARARGRRASTATDAASSSRPTASSARSTTCCSAVVQVTMMSTPAAATA